VEDRVSDEPKPEAAKDGRARPKTAQAASKLESPEPAAAKAAKAPTPAQKAAQAKRAAARKAANADVPPAAQVKPAVAATGPKVAQAKANGKKVSQPVTSAKLRRRHWAIMIGFLIYVILPVFMIGYYLWVYAADQYASTVAFSVRTEESSSALELLGGITELSGSSSSDTDILYEFLQSQKLVSEIDQAIDLRAIWSKPENDPIFSFDEEGTIEDLVNHWGRFVHISYDDGAGLIEVRVNAFDPADATAVAQALFEQSSAMINSLSDIAREDAIGYARQELDDAVERLRLARQEVTTFRNLNQLVDPSVDVNTQAGLMGMMKNAPSWGLVKRAMARSTPTCLGNMNVWSWTVNSESNAMPVRSWLMMRL